MTTQREVSFDGARTPVTGVLITPGASPAPGVLWLHWGFGDRTSFVAEARAAAAAGIASLLIDAPGVGRRGRGLPPLDRADDALAFHATCLGDLRAALAFMDQHPAFDHGPRGYVGHSLGATVGLHLVDDPRIGASVLMAPAGDPADVWSLRPDDAYRRALSTCRGTDVVARAPGALFFQFGRKDEWVTPSMAAALQAAAPSAHVHHYDVDHRLGGRATSERLPWLLAALRHPVPNDPQWLRGVRLPAMQVARYLMVRPVVRLLR